MVTPDVLVFHEGAIPVFAHHERIPGIGRLDDLAGKGSPDEEDQRHERVLDEIERAQDADAHQRVVDRGGQDQHHDNEHGEGLPAGSRAQETHAAPADVEHEQEPGHESAWLAIGPGAAS